MSFKENVEVDSYVFIKGYFSHIVQGKKSSFNHMCTFDRKLLAVNPDFPMNISE